MILSYCSPISRNHRPCEIVVISPNLLIIMCQKLRVRKVTIELPNYLIIVCSIFSIIILSWEGTSSWTWNHCNGFSWNVSENPYFALETVRISFSLTKSLLSCLKYILRQKRLAKYISASLSKDNRWSGVKIQNKIGLFVLLQNKHIAKLKKGVTLPLCLYICINNKLHFTHFICKSIKQIVLFPRKIWMNHQ